MQELQRDREGNHDGRASVHDKRVCWCQLAQYVDDELSHQLAEQPWREISWPSARSANRARITVPLPRLGRADEVIE
jgi:hypothetical protein